jgi:hypothetical protein
LSNRDLFVIIPDPGSQKWITLSLESISTVALQARASHVKTPEWGQYSSIRGMPCDSNIFGTFPRTGDQPYKNPGTLFRSTADIFSNIMDCELQRPDMLVTQKIDQVGLVGCTNDWHNRHSSRKLILHIAPPIACVDLAVYSATFCVCKVHRFTIDLRLQWEMCKKELDTFENILVV